MKVKHTGSRSLILVFSNLNSNIFHELSLQCLKLHDPLCFFQFSGLSRNEAREAVLEYAKVSEIRLSHLDYTEVHLDLHAI